MPPKKQKLSHKYGKGKELIWKVGKEISLGYVMDDNNTIGPFPPESAVDNDKSFTLTTGEKAVSSDTEKITDTSLLELGSRILVAQEQTNRDFRKLKVGTVLDFVNNDHVWVRVDVTGDGQQICDVGISQMYNIPDRYRDIPLKKETINQEIVLKEILGEACSKIDQLSQIEIRSRQLSDESHLLNTELIQLKDQYQEKENEIRKLSIDLQETINDCKRLNTENTNLKVMNTQLNRENEALTTQVSVEARKTPLLLEKQRAPKEGILMVRPKDSTGKFAPHVPVTLPGHDNPSARASKPALDHRVKELMKVLDILSSREKATEEDLVATLGHFFKKNQTLVKKAIKEAELNLYRELTPQETLDLKLLLRMTWSKFNMLRTYLSNKDLGVLASEPSMRKELKSRRNFTEETTEVGTKMMKKTAKDKPSKVSYVRTTNLQHHIEELLKKHLEAGNTWEDDKFSGDIWIKIGGDKDGSSTKLAVQIVNVKNPNSPDMTDLIACFEATDSDENMRLIFSIYTQMLLDMQEPGFVLRLGPDFGNMSCMIFIFGDYEFLCKCLGYSAASATYPCLWCLITRDQLRNPNGEPHCSKEKDDRGYWVERDGWPEDRTVESMLVDLQSNKDYTAARGGTTKTNASRFHNMHSDAILPLNKDKGMDHVVPPILHIMLGLVQRFFEYLEDTCREMDDDAEDGNFEGRDLYPTWVEDSETAQAKEKVWETEKEELAMRELLLEGFRKSSRGNEGGAAPPCEMPACALAAVNPWRGQRRVNDRVKWLRCSQCGDDGNSGWFHLSCVGLGISEYEDDAFVANFICPLCEGTIDSAADTVKMQVRRIESQKKVVKKAKDDYEKSKKKLEDTFAKISNEMGTKEKELNRILEEDTMFCREPLQSHTCSTQEACSCSGWP